MTAIEAIRARHSVRAYTDKPIPQEIRKALCERADALNREGGLHLQLVFDEPHAFSGIMAHYGRFSGVTNYIAVIGKDSDDLAFRAGYCGEQLVLLSQQLGLNTCWVALTFRKTKSAYTLGPGEKLVCVIALGYGATQGTPHHSKAISEISDCGEDTPDWYQNGVEAALLAPTAVNQQKFRLTRNGNRVTLRAGKGPYAALDLGIVRLHFEIGAGKDAFEWAD